ncbi:MAG: GGGtGRT protein, partial [Lentisphaeria bacterium]|nr:GGGtGRT protein [Lentisphaeria bacterium]
MSLFESYERRIAQINKFLNDNGIASIEEAEQITKGKGLDIYQRVKDIQPICFENACWAYLVGAAVAIKRGQTVASEIAKTLGEGLQSFCIPGSVADDRKVGIGHGNLASMLLSEETKCFAFCAGHESFAAAEGAIGLAKSANKVRKDPLRVILNGLGKDAAQISARIHGFTYVKTQFDYYTGELKIVERIPYSKGERAAVNCYGCDDVREGVAVMRYEGVDVS